MNTLYLRLKDIFLLHPTYNKFYTVEEIYPLLRAYIIKNIRLGETYIDPLDFSFNYALDIKFTNEIFLALSNKENLFEKFYCIECEDCSEITITDKLFEITQCVHCGHLTKNLESSDILNSIRFLYKISRPLKEEMIHDLKDQPSSFANIKEEGDKAIMKGESSSTFTPAYPNLEEERKKIADALAAVAKEQV